MLVNNAGCAWPGDIAAIDPDQLRDMLATNVLGALLPSQAVVARLLAGDAPGDVVFISSDAVHNPRPGLVTYGATKAAAEHIARGPRLRGRGNRDPGHHRAGRPHDHRLRVRLGRPAAVRAPSSSAGSASGTSATGA